MKQLAAPEDFAELENRYVEYTKKVSQLAAENDMKEVKKLIDHHNEEINDIQKKIQEISDTAKKRQEKFNEDIEKKNKSISSCESDFSKAKLKRLIRLITGAVVIICIIRVILPIVLWLFTNRPLGDRYSANLLLIIIIGFICFLIFGASIDKNSLKPKKEFIRDIESHQKSKELIKSQFDSDIVNIKQQIKKYKTEISNLQKKISDCQKYLELGKNKISLLWFAEDCKAFGVEQSCDSRIKESRMAVFGMAEAKKDIGETVSFDCPACGEKIVESRNNIASNGYVICKVCGNRIEVSVS